MKNYIVLSVNDDPQYLYYVPLTVWAWQKIGWTPILFWRFSMSLGIDQPKAGTDLAIRVLANLPCDVLPVEKIAGYRDDTITQVSRLYAAACINSKSMIMTGDVDMIPLSDYWHPEKNKITIYGEDLTGYVEYPICYIAMTTDKWREVMNIDNSDYCSLIERDLNGSLNAKSEDFYKYWGVDQQIATARIKASKLEKEMIPRGQLPSGLAKGRVDRGGWTLNHETFVDAHLHRDLYKHFQDEKNPELKALWEKKWTEHMALLNKIWANEDWDWFLTYTKEFAKIAP